MDAKMAKYFVARFTAESLRKFAESDPRIRKHFGPLTDAEVRKVSKQMLALATKLCPTEDNAVEPESRPQGCSEGADRLPRDG